MEQYNMAPKGSHILCALSGGADSVAMVKLLHSLRGQMELQLSAAHFSHGIRREKAQEEADLCRKLCEELGIAFYYGSGDTPAYAKEHKVGMEDAARRLRYDFLQQTARAVGATVVATAHNQDDNAETVLLNLLRGSGLSGLAGIPPVRQGIIRPVLCLGRKDIEAYLGNTPYVVDESNFSCDYTRNRLRHEIMPRLHEINSRANENIAMAGLRIRQENQFIEQSVYYFVNENWQQENGLFSCDICKLKEQNQGFLGRIVRAVYGAVGGDMGKLAAVHIDAVVQLVLTKLPPKYIMMPGGIKAALMGKKLILYNGNGENNETRY